MLAFWEILSHEKFASEINWPLAHISCFSCQNYVHNVSRIFLTYIFEEFGCQISQKSTINYLYIPIFLPEKAAEFWILQKYEKISDWKSSYGYLANKVKTYPYCPELSKWPKQKNSYSKMWPTVYRTGFFGRILPHWTDVRFSSFFSVGFITAIVVNPPERKLAKRTSVHCTALHRGPSGITLTKNFYVFFSFYTETKNIKNTCITQISTFR